MSAALPPTSAVQLVKFGRRQVGCGPAISLGQGDCERSDLVGFEWWGSQLNGAERLAALLRAIAAGNSSRCCSLQ